MPWVASEHLNAALKHITCPSCGNRPTGLVKIRNTTLTPMGLGSFSTPHSWKNYTTFICGPCQQEWGVENEELLSLVEKEKVDVLIAKLKKAVEEFTLL